MHDDIEYHSQNWGEAVLNHFHQENTGMIGIAGTPYYSKFPGSWWSCGLVNEYLLPWKDGAVEPTVKSTKPGTIRNKVVAVDGVWICIRKQLFDHVKFDEKNYKGFHFYDIDISMQIQALGCDIFSVFDILIKHCSHGNINRDWLCSALTFRKKWSRSLPAACIDIDYFTRCKLELRTLNEFIAISLNNKEKAPSVYKLACREILKRQKHYFYYKTPFYFLKYLSKSFKLLNP